METFYTSNLLAKPQTSEQGILIEKKYYNIGTEEKP
jgi:hypothetical protein